MRKGLTLIELMIAMVMVAILMGVAAYIFRAILLSWSTGVTRAGVDIGLDSGVEKMVRDLRKARNVTYVNPNEIRFTQNQSMFYIYYFYNSSDTYPPSFSQSSYQLRKANWTGNISGTFGSYGSGDIIMNDVLNTSNLSCSGNMTTIDLSAKRQNETIRSKAQVRPRNVL